MTEGRRSGMTRRGFLAGLAAGALALALPAPPALRAPAPGSDFPEFLAWLDAELQRKFLEYEERYFLYGSGVSSKGLLS